MAADRGAFIDQSQSMNVFMEIPNYAKVSSMHFYAMEKGLKTGMYYLRSKPASDAIKFTVDRELVTEMNNKSVEAAQLKKSQIDEFVIAQSEISCSLDDPDGCEACGS